MRFVRYQSQLAKAVPALVGMVLCGTVVVWSSGTTASSARAAIAHRATAVARTVPVEWDAYAVGPHETSLELIVERGMCGPIQTAVVEGHDSVVIEIDEEQEPGACLAVAAVGTLDVQLAHPLAGRAIQGPSRRHFQALVSRSRLDSVPRLVGFAPQDASHALALVSLRERTSTAHGTGGLQRVVAQYPAPGQPVPKSRTVRITITEHRQAARAAALSYRVALPAGVEIRMKSRPGRLT